MVPWHIEGKLHGGWQTWFTDFLEGGSPQVNRDFRPLGLFYSISHWNALFAPTFGALFRQFERLSLGTIFIAFALFLLVYYPLRPRDNRRFPAAIRLSIVTTGFAGMLFSLVVIFAFQSVYGYLFSWIGLLTAAFMAGAASGALLMTKALARAKTGVGTFVKTELAIIGVAIGLPLVFTAANTYAGSQAAFVLFRALFLIVPFVCGLVTGSQFPLANRLYQKRSVSLSRTAGLLYASDLLGGWLGGIVGGVVLLPVLGLAGTCITVGLLKGASLIVVATQPQAVLMRRS
jgi:spermidine synthase